MKLITVFFDLEGPFLWRKDKAEYDLERTVQGICEVLNRFNVKATFNTCGIVAEKFPEMISRLHDEGHEIASHAYAHEDFLRNPINKLDEILARTERILKNITGERPIGVRSPWVIRNKEVYSVLNRREYKWASNWYVPFWTTKSRIHLHTLSYPEWFAWDTFYDLKWMFHKKNPFYIGNVMEIPLLSPLDVNCIYPFPEPNESSPKASLEEAYKILVKHYRSSKRYFNLNFHEHAVGTCNRITVLNEILDYLSNQPDTRFVLSRQLMESISYET